MGKKKKTTTATWWTSGGSVKPKKTCTHWRQRLELAPGVVVFASGSRHQPKEPWYYLDLGVYFSTAWRVGERSYWSYSTGWHGPNFVAPPDPVPNEIAVLDWPDWSTPHDGEELVATLEYALNQAAKGRSVEVGCIGGHGRTGTALALMLLMLGEHDADKAMQWVWDNYCIEAIESKKQEDWLWRMACALHPEAKALFDQRYPPKAKSDKPDVVLTAGDWGAALDDDDDFWGYGFWLNAAQGEVDYLVSQGTPVDEAIASASDVYDVLESDLYGSSKKG